MIPCMLYHVRNTQQSHREAVTFADTETANRHARYESIVNPDKTYFISGLVCGVSSLWLNGKQYVPAKEEG